MRQPPVEHTERVAAHARVATRLALLSDRRLAELVAAAAPAGAGVGGRCAELEVDGTPVFVKRVPLTDLELRPEHVRSTANLFGLPMFYQYELARGAAFMSAHSLVHFDAHLRNLLTDGRRIHFADFGLALSTEFELDAAERQFLTDHLGYDHHHTASHLIRYHLLDRLPPGTDPDALLRDRAAGRGPADLPADLAAILDRHARSVLVLDGFHRRLLTESKRTPYPAAIISSLPPGR
ncbi:hypothetical protein ACPC54_09275 [Kitasatospora sp. NPDC094028]